MSAAARAAVTASIRRADAVNAGRAGLNIFAWRDDADAMDQATHAPEGPLAETPVPRPYRDLASCENLRFACSTLSVLL